MTVYRVESEAKEAAEVLRFQWSTPTRIRPHWEVFAILVQTARERPASWWSRRLARWDRERAARGDD